MKPFSLHNQNIGMSYSTTEGGVKFKLDVDGDLRDQTSTLNLPRSWCTIARAGVFNASGQKRELELQAKKTGLGFSFEWQFLYDGNIVASEFDSAGDGSDPRKHTTALLAFLLGTFGVHKFYLGQRAWGVLYLLFCWSGVPTILGVIESIFYIFHSDERWLEKYCG